MSDELDELPTPRRTSVLPWVLFFLTLGVAGVGAYFSWSSLDELHAEVKASRDRVARAESGKTEAADRQKAIEAQLESTKGDLEKLQAEKEALSGDLQTKDAEIARLKSTYDRLEDKLQTEIKKGDIKLTNVNGQIKVDMVDKILFDSGQAELSPRGKEVLLRVADGLKGVDDKLIQVSGHTDDSPITRKLVAKYPTNWELSSARAVNVVRQLQDKGKVAPKKLVAAGYGQFHPLVSNSSANGRAANRRIEILLMPEVQRASAKVAKKK